jgi:CRP/FNR family transcriptional regulator
MQAAVIHSPALELLRAFGDRPRLAKRGDRLIRLGETQVDIFLLASGWACREHLRPNGDQAVLDLYLPGDLVGLDNLVDDEAAESIIALTAAVYYTLSRNAFEFLLLCSPSVGLHVIKKAVEERRRGDEQRLELAGLNAIERTAAFLLHMCERLQRHGLCTETQDQSKFTLPLTQQRLAEYLGLHPIHLNRTLRILRESAIANFSSGQVTIDSLIRLRHMAGYHPRQPDQSIAHSACVFPADRSRPGPVRSGATAVCPPGAHSTSSPHPPGRGSPSA